ncbi:MAG: Do family serine endopeptidase [Planctomycetaceae bacterium]|nr:Do family serine endopeptidase [Planctomycetaceae bacterium]
MSSSTWRQYAAGIALGAAVAAGITAWGPRQQAIAVPSAATPQDMSNMFRSVAAQTMPSIVSIETTTRPRQVDRGRTPFDDEGNPFREFFRDDPRFREFFENPRRMMTPRRSGAGSGFIIDPSGIIMTNNHVVQGADEVKVRLHDGREFLATDIKTDPRTDVAVLRIKDAGQLQAIKLGDSRAMQVGDWVLAFGSPFGLEMTVTQGIISGTSRHRGITDREDFLQTDAAINPGNSGGPLVNLKGEVIGINTAIASTSGGYDGVGFAIPTHIASWVGDQLVKSGQVQRGYLGTSIAAVDAETAKQFDVKVRDGVIVKQVMPDSPADKAGLESGDVIRKLNDQVVVDPPSLQGIVERLAIGKSYKLEVIREGKPVTLNVTIEELPKSIAASSAEPESPSEGTQFDKLGLELSVLTPNLAKQLGIPNATGVVVTGVKDGSLAALAGIDNGDVIERVGNSPVKTTEEFQAAVEKLSLKEGIVIHLRNAEGKRYVILRDAGE